MLLFHVSCFQMNQKMSCSEIKSLFRTQEKRIYDAFMLLEYQQQLQKSYVSQFDQQSTIQRKMSEDMSSNQQ